MSQPNYDLAQWSERGVSIRPGTVISGGTGADGIGVDLINTVGPVQGIGIHGLITGTPTSFTHTFELQESATKGGTYTNMQPRKNASLSALDDIAICKGTRTLRFGRMSVTDAFTGGTTPTSEVCGIIFAQRVHAPA